MMAVLTVGCQRTQVRQVSNPEEIRELNQQVLTAANVSPDSAMYMAYAYASLSEKGKVNSEKFASAQKAKEYVSLFEQCAFAKKKEGFLETKMKNVNNLFH